MITTSKHYVMEGKERIWELPRDVVLERIANCVRLNEEYQKAFQRYGIYIVKETIFGRNNTVDYNLQISVSAKRQ